MHVCMVIVTIVNVKGTVTVLGKRQATKYDDMCSQHSSGGKERFATSLVTLFLCDRSFGYPHSPLFPISQADIPWAFYYRVLQSRRGYADPIYGNRLREKGQCLRVSPFALVPHLIGRHSMGILLQGPC